MPESSTVGKVTLVFDLKFVPSSVMLWPTLAERSPESVGVPKSALATRSVNDVGPTSTTLLVPPAVVTLTSAPGFDGMTLFIPVPLENTSMVVLLMFGSTTSVPPKWTVMPPSTKPRPLSCRLRDVPDGLKSLFVNDVILGTTCRKNEPSLPGMVTLPVTAVFGTVTTASVPSPKLVTRTDVVPTTPVSLTVGKLTLVFDLNPAPMTVMACPTFAEGWPLSVGVPKSALAVRSVNDVGPISTTLLVPPSVVTLTSAPGPTGITETRALPLDTTSMVMLFTFVSTTSVSPKWTVMPPSI